MKLADLLADSGHDDLARLAQEHAKTDDQLTRPQLLSTIESVLRSYRFVQDLLVNQQPPTFAILTLLLDAEAFALPTAQFRALVLAETERICVAIDDGEVLKRDDHLRVYRRVLYQARSNDLQIDASEAAILGVLRQELDVAHVEHFLIEHHADLREFWSQDGAFMRELYALRSAGLLFEKEGMTILPEDLVGVVRQVLGVDMSRPAARRLFQLLSVGDLHDALREIGAPSSGSKEERVERLIAHMVQPRAVLRGAGIETLRAICRDVGAVVSGAKEDLVGRLVGHFAAGRDLVTESVPPPPPPVEERRLTEERFSLLFAELRGQDLAGILGEHGLRRWGPKPAQIGALWSAQRSEATLLSFLSNPEMDALLRRVGLKVGGGSKLDRIERLLSHFGSLEMMTSNPGHSAAEAEATGDAG